MVKNPTFIEQSLIDYFNELAATYKLNKVILFGSQVQGNARTDSDIDIAIFSADATNQNRLEMMANCLLKTLPYKLDIQPLVFPLSDYEGDNDFIQQEIIARGIEIMVDGQPVTR